MGMFFIEIQKTHLYSSISARDIALCRIYAGIFLVPLSVRISPTIYLDAYSKAAVLDLKNRLLVTPAVFFFLRKNTEKTPLVEKLNIPTTPTSEKH